MELFLPKVLEASAHSPKVVERSVRMPKVVEPNTLGVVSVWNCFCQGS